MNDVQKLVQESGIDIISLTKALIGELARRKTQLETKMNKLEDELNGEIDDNDDYAKLEDEWNLALQANEEVLEYAQESLAD